MRPRCATLLIAIAIAGCASSTSPTPNQTATATSRTTASPATQAPPEPADGITGWGATRAAWNSAHTADTRFNSDSAYDPDPSLLHPGEDPKFDDRYYAVTEVTGNRVTTYQMRFPPHTTVTEARQLVMGEFPGDAHVTKFRTLDSWAQILVRSRKLARAHLSQPAVEFISGQAGDTYEP